ncbi:MAG: hypothetical protein PUI06_07515 [Prevotella sp.]|nr:hypothetical protein [Prevotella sp.]MDY5667431.1 hypothetical protein [Alloprevotella sp.]
MAWRTLLPINIGFIGHVARYVPSSTYVYERNTAPIHINYALVELVNKLTS